MGNILERGFGHSPYGNRLQHVAGMQIVLASGERARHRLRPLPEGAQATHLFPYGVGPFLDGLFTQSNLGIVTRIGIWLMPHGRMRATISCARGREHADIAAGDRCPAAIAPGRHPAQHPAHRQ